VAATEPLVSPEADTSLPGPEGRSLFSGGCWLLALLNIFFWSYRYLYRPMTHGFDVHPAGVILSPLFFGASLFHAFGIRFSSELFEPAWSYFLFGLLLPILLGSGLWIWVASIFSRPRAAIHLRARASRHTLLFLILLVAGGQSFVWIIFNRSLSRVSIFVLSRPMLHPPLVRHGMVGMTSFGAPGGSSVADPGAEYLDAQGFVFEPSSLLSACDPVVSHPSEIFGLHSGEDPVAGYLYRGVEMNDEASALTKRVSFEFERVLNGHQRPYKRYLDLFYGLLSAGHFCDAEKMLGRLEELRNFGLLTQKGEGFVHEARSHYEKKRRESQARAETGLECGEQ